MSRLDNLIHKLEQFTELIWKSDFKGFIDNSNELLSILFQDIPIIISLYSNDSMSDLSDDALYWPTQVEKIVKLINNKNDFLAIADSLYFELRANIIELKKILLEREIIVEGFNNV